MGAKLRRCRLNLDMTQSDVAKALQIPISTYNSYELNERIPKDEMKKKIAELYNESILYLFFGD